MNEVSAGTMEVELSHQQRKAIHSNAKKLKYLSAVGEVCNALPAGKSARIDRAQQFGTTDTIRGGKEKKQKDPTLAWTSNFYGAQD